jgi:hypothetical protein
MLTYSSMDPQSVPIPAAIQRRLLTTAFIPFLFVNRTPNNQCGPWPHCPGIHSTAMAQSLAAAVQLRCCERREHAEQEAGLNFF